MHVHMPPNRPPQLLLEGRSFRFIGFNAYWLADYGYEVRRGGG